jgi:hypothetical protein
MRAFHVLLGVALGLSSLSGPAQAACNVRGEYCGYPAWAANAFSDPFDRVPEAWLERPTNAPAYGYVDPSSRKKRDKRSHKRQR